MAKSLLAAVLAALVAGCAMQGTPTAFNPTPPGDMLGGWYDGTGPRGRSGGGP